MLTLKKEQQLQIANQLPFDPKLQQSQYIVPFSRNQTFIIYLGWKCSNFYQIKSEVLTKLWNKTEDQINKFINSTYFQSRKNIFKKRCAALKNQLKNERFQWRINYENQLQNILIKHHVKTLAFKKNRKMNLQFLDIQLLAFFDVDLSNFFKNGRNYDWIVFLVYVSLRTNRNSLQLLSNILDIPSQKIDRFYQLRKVALADSQNQDCNRYRYLYLLWDSQQEKQKIVDQTEKLLIEEAIKKYGQKQIKAPPPKNIQNQLIFKEIKQDFQNYWSCKRDFNGQKKIYKRQIQENRQLKDEQFFIQDQDSMFNINENRGKAKRNSQLSLFDESDFDLEKPYHNQVSYMGILEQKDEQKQFSKLDITTYNQNLLKQFAYKDNGLQMKEFQKYHKDYKQNVQKVLLNQLESKCMSKQDMFNRFKLEQFYEKHSEFGDLNDAVIIQSDQSDDEQNQFNNNEFHLSLFIKQQSDDSRQTIIKQEQYIKQKQKIIEQSQQIIEQKQQTIGQVQKIVEQVQVIIQQKQTIVEYAQIIEQNKVQNEQNEIQNEQVQVQNEQNYVDSNIERQMIQNRQIQCQQQEQVNKQDQQQQRSNMKTQQQQSSIEDNSMEYNLRQQILQNKILYYNQQLLNKSLQIKKTYKTQKTQQFSYKYSLEDQAILYFLYSIDGLDGIMIGQQILQIPKQQLFKHFQLINHNNNNFQNLLSFIQSHILSCNYLSQQQQFILPQQQVIQPQQQYISPQNQKTELIAYSNHLSFNQSDIINQNIIQSKQQQKIIKLNQKPYNQQSYNQQSNNQQSDKQQQNNQQSNNQQQNKQYINKQYLNKQQLNKNYKLYYIKILYQRLLHKFNQIQSINHDSIDSIDYSFNYSFHSNHNSHSQSDLNQSSFNQIQPFNNFNNKIDHQHQSSTNLSSQSMIDFNFILN